MKRREFITSAVAGSVLAWLPQYSRAEANYQKLLILFPFWLLKLSKHLPDSIHENIQDKPLKNR